MTTFEINMEYKANDFIGQNYERKIELERLTPPERPGSDKLNY